MSTPANLKFPIEPFTDRQARAALKNWAAILRALPPGLHNQTCWANSCGTPSCVAGWGTNVPQIAAKGVALVEVASGFYRIQFVGVETSIKSFFDLATKTYRGLFSSIPEIEFDLLFSWYAGGQDKLADRLLGLRAQYYPLARKRGKNG